MDLQTFQAYRSATDPKQAQQLLGKLIQNEDDRVKRCAFALTRVVGGHQFEDLKQAGYVGLLSAFRLFDAQKGDWPRYAKRWITMEMHRQIVDRTPMIPGAKHSKSRITKKVRRAKQVFEAAHGRKATAEDVGVSSEVWDRWAQSNVQVAYEQPGGLDLQMIEDKTERPMLSDSFVRVMCRLTTTEQRIFLKAVFEDVPHEDIAAQENLDKEQIPFLLKKTKEKLREYWSRVS